MKTPKILVTGGTGYIGSYLGGSLMEQGYKVILIDNLSNSERDVLNGIAGITGSEPSFHEIDMRDSNILNYFLSYAKGPSSDPEELRCAASSGHASHFPTLFPLIRQCRPQLVA